MDPRVGMSRREKSLAPAAIDPRMGQSIA